MGSGPSSATSPGSVGSGLHPLPSSNLFCASMLQVKGPAIRDGGHILLGARVEATLELLMMAFPFFSFGLCQASRNLADFCFPSAIARDARAELERLLTKASVEVAPAVVKCSQHQVPHGFHSFRHFRIV